MKKKMLRSGYTTGACAAAAAKAAVLVLLDERAVGAIHELPLQRRGDMKTVEIPFPDGSRIKFKIQDSRFRNNIAVASVIKDAGDDPDITHGAEIVAEASVGAIHELPLRIIISGGKGVGTVTKPGLSVPVGEPAINPVPRKMIEEAVAEAVLESSKGSSRTALAVEITISVPRGEELAKKTLNARLGIKGGISILGTTGIVKPVSTEAWTATITSSMDVAKATGFDEIVLSAGRTSEKAHMKKYGLPEEAYVLMGDHLEYSLLEAKKHGFKKIHLCAQWAKMVKIAMATPQTHVRFGAIDTKKAVKFLNSLGIDIPQDRSFNTAREIFDFINSSIANPHSAFMDTCNTAKKYADQIAVGVTIVTYLVSYSGEIVIASS